MATNDSTDDGYISVDTIQPPPLRRAVAGDILDTDLYFPARVLPDFSGIHVVFHAESDLVQAAQCSLPHVKSVEVHSVVHDDVVAAFVQALREDRWVNLEYLFVGGFSMCTDQVTEALENGACSKLKVVAISCDQSEVLHLLTVLASSDVCPDLRRVDLIGARPQDCQVAIFRNNRPRVEVYGHPVYLDGTTQCGFYYNMYGSHDDVLAFCGQV